MEVREAILNRRSIRQYQDREIPQTILEEILEAGAYAPSAVDLQPWYFVVIRSRENMLRLAEVMGRVSRQIRPALQERFVRHPEVVEETTRFLRQLGGAPVCILAFVLRPDYTKTESTIIQSVSAALENILLAAADKGLGGCWLTAPLEAGLGDELRDVFAPGKGGFVAMLTLGYPARLPKAPARKEGRYVMI